MSCLLFSIEAISWLSGRMVNWMSTVNLYGKYSSSGKIRFFAYNTNNLIFHEFFSTAVYHFPLYGCIYIKKKPHVFYGYFVHAQRHGYITWYFIFVEWVKHCRKQRTASPPFLAHRRGNLVILYTVCSHHGYRRYTHRVEHVLHTHTLTYSKSTFYALHHHTLCYSPNQISEYSERKKTTEQVKQRTSCEWRKLNVILECVDELLWCWFLLMVCMYDHYRKYFSSLYFYTQ